MSADLKQATDEEAVAIKAYEELMAVKKRSFMRRTRTTPSRC